jgi:hypothetical protein
LGRKIQIVLYLLSIGSLCFQLISKAVCFSEIFSLEKINLRKGKDFGEEMWLPEYNEEDLLSVAEFIFKLAIPSYPDCPDRDYVDISCGEPFPLTLNSFGEWCSKLPKEIELIIVLVIVS